MWWMGFRQVRSKRDAGRIVEPGAAVVCGPYKTEGEAHQERLRRLSSEWDAAYSFPYEADCKEAASATVEERTPRS